MDVTNSASQLAAPSRRCLHGFTLIELLVVFTLLALLLSIAVPRYLNATQAAGMKVRAQNLATLRDAIDKFHADQGRYPTILTELVQKNYLRALPLDPVTGSSEWVVIKHPTPGEVGVFDVAAPELVATDGTRPTAPAVKEGGAK